MGTMKERNDLDITEEESVRKRWQEYTEVLYKRILMTQITMIITNYPRLYLITISIP